MLKPKVEGAGSNATCRLEPSWEMFRLLGFQTGEPRENERETVNDPEQK